MSELNQVIQHFRRRLFQEGGDFSTAELTNFNTMLEELVLNWKNHPRADEDRLILMVKILNVLFDAYLLGYDIEKPHTSPEDSSTILFGIKL